MGNLNLILGLSNLAVATVAIAFAVPLVRRKVKMNQWYGVRIKEAFESNDNWYAINAYGGKRLILWGWVLAALGVLSFFMPLQHQPLPVLFACAPFVLMVPCIEAGIFARKL